MPIRQVKALPVRLHRIHLARLEEVLCVLVEVVRDLQLAQMQRSHVLGPFTKCHIGLLPRRLNALGLFSAAVFAVVTNLSASVWMSMERASQLPGSFGTVRDVSVPRTRYVIVVATFSGPSVGQSCAVVAAVFATPLDTHRKKEG